MEFLTSVNYDHSLLLDFLISNETHFLPYFYNYLRHLANDWHGFVVTVEERRVLTKDGKLPEGNSSGSPSSKLGAAKSFNADDGDDDDGGLMDHSGIWCDTGSHSDGDMVGDIDGYNTNGASGVCDEIGNGDNDGYKDGDYGDDDGEIRNGNNDGYNYGEGDMMNNVQRILTCLIRLRYSIERMSAKGLFPYTVTALVKIMEHIETLYEGEG